MSPQPNTEPMASMNPKDLYSAGKLDDAIQAALTAVKANPGDKNMRFFLAELLCFGGEWERADRQLDSVVQQSTDANLLALLFRQLIRAEIIRDQVFSEGRAPELVVALPRDAELQLELCAALRLKHGADVPKLVSAAEEARGAPSGECNGQAFTGIRDLDDRIAGVLEVLTANGKYFWVPWASVKTLELEKPQRPMDLLWRKASIDVAEGPEGEVYIPTRYPGAASPDWDAQLRLGRSTAWRGDEDTAVTGMGLRMLLAGEEALSIMELTSLSLTQA